MQDVAYNVPFTATIFGTFSAGAGGLNSNTYTVSSDANGDPQFIGIADSAASIQSVTIDVPTTGAGGDPQFYAIGPISLTDSNPAARTPEPASLMLVAGGLFALGWKARRRSRG